VIPIVRWSGPGGGEAEVTALDGDRVALLSTAPHAPGSRPEGALEGAGTVRVKVARCRRQGERFLVEGRLLEATRALRADIERRLAAGRDDGGGSGQG
jgi:hypothetical protein